MPPVGRQDTFSAHKRNIQIKTECVVNLSVECVTESSKRQISIRKEISELCRAFDSPEISMNEFSTTRSY